VTWTKHDELTCGTTAWISVSDQNRMVALTAQKVTLPGDSHRGGLLTQASILKLTADGSTTSPVKRGNFIVTNFLGEPPNPPTFCG